MGGGRGGSGVTRGLSLEEIEAMRAAAPPAPPPGAEASAGMSGLGMAQDAARDAVTTAAATATAAVATAASSSPPAVQDAAASGVDAVAAAASTAAATTTAVATATATAAAADAPQRYEGWLSPLSDNLEKFLKAVHSGLEFLHVPYAYGFSIILLVFLVRMALFPLAKKTVETSLATKSLKPRIDLIKARYGDDKDRVSVETKRLYDEAKVNPLAGCIPTLVQIPVFIGLYRSLSNLAQEGLLEKEGFFWIPSLAAPTSIAARQAGSGTAWLLPLDENGAPPIGWEAAAPYLVLPVLLVVAQYASNAILQEEEDEEEKARKKKEDEDSNEAVKVLVKVLPLMLGWFSLNVPSGLSLYYFSNTMTIISQQIYLRKLGGAKAPEFDLPEVTRLGAARKTGSLADVAPDQAVVLEAEGAVDSESFDRVRELEANVAIAATAQAEFASDGLDRRCRRRRRVRGTPASMIEDEDNGLPDLGIEIVAN